MNDQEKACHPAETESEHLQDKGLDEAFWPIFELDEPEKEKNQVIQGGMRFGVAASLIGLSYAFYHHVPDRGEKS